jgi:hypothetical protein
MIFLFLFVNEMMWANSGRGLGGRMRLFILAVLIIGQVSADSGKLKKRIMRNLQAIEDVVFDGGHIPEQDLRSALKKLREAKRILRGNGAGELSFACVSRDNDGHRPFILEARDDDFNSVRLKNILFSSKENCQNSVKTALELDQITVLCASRDGDGMRPIIPYTIMGTTANAKTEVAFTSFDQCKTQLASGRRGRTVFAFCSSRDGDGMSPYRQFHLNLSSGSITGKNTYNSLSECQNTIR